MLFNVYLDDLNIKLNQSGIDGVIGAHLINHLCCADDLYLKSLSSAGMQKLLDMCSIYATEHLLTYKDVLKYVQPKHIKLYVPCFYLNMLEIPKVDQCKYLGIYSISLFRT